ncbi:hypothetical protein M1N54_03670 [Thermodesulfovibrionales bacterium]|nr:hypothetical protein [Thermodesulfovibrionales bacterium]
MYEFSCRLSTTREFLVNNHPLAKRRLSGRFISRISTLKEESTNAPLNSIHLPGFVLPKGRPGLNGVIKDDPQK